MLLIKAGLGDALGTADNHKDKDPVATGTAKIIAASFKFNIVLELKEYIDKCF
jgi:hypothetical protein